MGKTVCLPDILQMGDQDPVAPSGCRDSVRPVAFEDTEMEPVNTTRPTAVHLSPEPPRRLRRAGDADFYDSGDDGTMPVVQGSAGNRAMHLNEEAAMDAAWELAEDEILEIEVAKGAESDDLFARWVAEEEAAEKKRKKKAKKSKKRKCPVADVDVSLFFQLSRLKMKSTPSSPPKK